MNGVVNNMEFGEIVTFGSPILDALYNSNTTEYGVICDYNKDTDLYTVYIKGKGLRYCSSLEFRDNRNNLEKALMTNKQNSILDDDKYKNNPNIDRIKEIFREVGL